MPVNSDVTPRLSVFFMVILLESAASLIATCVVLVVHHRGDESEEYPIPKWVRKIFIDILARKLGYLNNANDNQIHQGQGEDHHWNQVSMDAEVDQIFKHKVAKKVKKRKIKRRSERSVVAALGKVRKTIQNAMKTPPKDINKDWKIVGKVLDRISFFVFFLTLVISSVAILVPAYLHK